MSKWFIAAGIIIFLLLADGVTMYFVGRHSMQGKPQVVDETSTNTVIKKPPKTDTDKELLLFYTACYYNPFQAAGKFRTDKWFDVEFTDGCKSGTKSFKIERPKQALSLQIFIQPLFLIGYDSMSRKFDFLPGGQVGVIWDFGLFGIGGGPIYARSLINKNSQYFGGSMIFTFNP